MDLVLRSAAILAASSAKYDLLNSRCSAVSQPGSTRFARSAVTSSDCAGCSGRAALLVLSSVSVGEVEGGTSRGRFRNFSIFSFAALRSPERRSLLQRTLSLEEAVCGVSQVRA